VVNSEYPVLLSGLAISALGSFVLVWLAAIVCRRLGMVDQPGSRQSHMEPTVTGSGIGLIVALIISSILLNRFVAVSPEWIQIGLPGLAALTVVGWMDDRQPLSNSIRLLIQLVVSFALLAFLALNGWPFGWLQLLLGGFAMMWVMNFYNFMDGSHGMAGFQGVFSGLLLGYIFLQNGAPALAVPAFLIAAVCAGFLPLNFPKPRVFMGDSGSVPLGFSFATLRLSACYSDTCCVFR
jgi:UDP-N-acetylmuramyl pentapeptide phosphotransferase/UDP-N-acetylglucosamine-1-phosphate transferase